MNWRELVAMIRPCEPPLPDLIRVSADRAGNVDRRTFLQLAGTAVAALSIDPERLIWTPAEKMVFVPAAPTLAGDTLQLYARGNLRKGDVVTWGLESVARNVGAVRSFSRVGFVGSPRYLGVVLADARKDGTVFVQTTPRAATRGFEIR